MTVILLPTSGRPVLGEGNKGYQIQVTGLHFEVKVKTNDRVWVGIVCSSLCLLFSFCPNFWIACPVEI